MNEALSSAEQVKTHAETMELHGVNYLDKFGVAGAREEQIVAIKLFFIDGAVFTVLPVEFQKLAGYEFKLRPRDNDS